MTRGNYHTFRTALYPGTNVVGAVLIATMALGAVGLAVGGCLTGRPTGVDANDITGVDASRDRQTDVSTGGTTSGTGNTVLNTSFFLPSAGAGGLALVGLGLFLRFRRVWRVVDTLLAGVENHDGTVSVKKFMRMHPDGDVRRAVAGRVRRLGYNKKGK